MKTEDILLIAAGLAAAYIIWRSLRPATNKTAPVYPTKITEYEGYNYFTDGTVIAPNGDYFYQGNLLWSAAQ